MKTTNKVHWNDWRKFDRNTIYIVILTSFAGITVDSGCHQVFITQTSYLVKDEDYILLYMHLKKNVV